MESCVCAHMCACTCVCVFLCSLYTSIVLTLFDFHTVVISFLVNLMFVEYEVSFFIIVLTSSVIPSLNIPVSIHCVLLQFCFLLATLLSPWKCLSLSLTESSIIHSYWVYLVDVHHAAYQSITVTYRYETQPRSFLPEILNLCCIVQ
jgi:hypothetical protein